MALNTSIYESQRRSVNDTHAANQATNAYSRTLSQQRGNRNVADFKQSFGRSQPGFTSSWGRRGLTGGGVQSGAFQGALQRRVGDYTRDLGRMQTDMAQNNQQYQMQGARFTQERQNALAEIEARKQAEIAQAALNLTALRPYF